MATLSGFKDFSGFGSKPTPLGAIQVESLTDPVIQSHMSVAEQIVKNMCGYLSSEALPDNPAIDNSIYILTLFFIENVSSQEVTQEFSPASELNFRKVSYYRERVLPAVLKQITMMISPFVKIKRFIPSAEENYATAT